MKAFIKLTTIYSLNGNIIKNKAYVNSKYITAIYPSNTDDVPWNTCVSLLGENDEDTGSLTVVESPETVLEMVKGAA